MFSTKEWLDKRTGPHGIGRLPHLQSLVSEFQETVNEGAKLEIAANLANFSYDPINYEYLKILNVVDLFLDCLTENNEQLIKLAMAGLCNIIIDNDVKADILSSEGFMLITDCLNRSDEETLLSTLTTVYYLLPLPNTADPNARNHIASKVSGLSASNNIRISNLAHLIMAQM